MRTFVASLIVLLFVSVPAYATEAKKYGHEASKEIILKGKILAFGTLSTGGSLHLSIKYKGRLFSCLQEWYGNVVCNEQ